MHRKSGRNERRAHPSTPIVNVETGSLAPIHAFPEFSTAYRFAGILATYVFRDDISFSSLLFFSFCLFLLKDTRVPTLFSTRPFFSFIRPRFNWEFRLFEQRREYYSVDYARFFRLGSALHDFRRAVCQSVFFSRICMHITVQDKWRFQTLREISLGRPVIYFKYYNTYVIYYSKIIKKETKRRLIIIYNYLLLYNIT